MGKDELFTKTDRRIQRHCTIFFPLRFAAIQAACTICQACPHSSPPEAIALRESMILLLEKRSRAGTGSRTWEMTAVGIGSGGRGGEVLQKAPTAVNGSEAYGGSQVRV